MLTATWHIAYRYLYAHIFVKYLQYMQCFFLFAHFELEVHFSNFSYFCHYSRLCVTGQIMMSG